MEPKNINKLINEQFIACAKAIINLEVEEAKFLKSEVELSFALGDKAIINIYKVNSGYKKGEFGMVSHFRVFNSHIEKIIKLSGLDMPFKNDTIVQGHYDMIKKLDFEPYFFNNNTDIKKAVNGIVSDIQDYFVPFIKSVTYDYRYAVTNFAENFFFLRLTNPFSVGVVLSFLANEENFIQELVEMATKSFPIDLFDRKDCFYDYHNSSNPQKNIIDPIKNWFEKNPNWTEKLE